MVKTWESENLVIPTSITRIKGKLTVGVAVFLVRIYDRSMNAAPSYAGRHSRRGAHHGRHGFFQSGAGRPHLDPQARQGEDWPWASVLRRSPAHEIPYPPGPSSTPIRGHSPAGRMRANRPDASSTPPSAESPKKLATIRASVLVVNIDFLVDIAAFLLATSRRHGFV